MGLLATRWHESIRGLRGTRPQSRRRRDFAGRPLETLEGRSLLATLAPPVLSPSSVHAAEVRPHQGNATEPDAVSGIVQALARRHRKADPPGDPAVVGSWTAPVKFKPPGAKGAYLAIHATVLPNGKVLAWPHDYNYFLKNKVAARYTPNILLWDPATNTYSHANLPGTNLFCSGHAFLPDGRLLVLGGHGPAAVPVKGLQTHYGQNHAEIYDFRTDTWTRAEDMGEGRYYGSAVTLGTGEVLVVAGYTEDGYNNPEIEIYKAGQGWRTLTGATTKGYPDWYPHIYQLSNGLIYGSVPGAHTFFIDPTGAGKIWAGPQMNYPRRYYGTSVMYDTDKILAIGGNAARGTAASGSNRLITNTAETIDLTGPNPQWHYTGSMQFARFFPSATLLPDGTTLVTGGTREQDNASGNALRGAVYAAEQWDPKTGRWTTLGSMSVPRMYHSTAILLPDATVLVAGGGQPEGTGEPKGTIHDTMQIFSPPYLFHGPQPVIASAPDSARYGASIDVTSPDAASITNVNLVRLGSITHGFNMTQRIEKLSLEHNPDGSLKVTMPTNPNAAPPGYYMMFILNGQGVPSKAKIINLTS